MHLFELVGDKENTTIARLRKLFLHSTEKATKLFGEAHTSDLSPAARDNSAASERHTPNRRGRHCPARRSREATADTACVPYSERTWTFRTRPVPGR